MWKLGRPSGRLEQSGRPSGRQMKLASVRIYLRGPWYLPKRRNSNQIWSPRSDLVPGRDLVAHQVTGASGRRSGRGRCIQLKYWTVTHHLWSQNFHICFMHAWVWRKNLRKSVKGPKVNALFLWFWMDYSLLAYGSASIGPRTALLLRTEMTILRAGKLSPLFHEVTVT